MSTFGIDLRKYDETNREKETVPVPRVLALLLEWVEKKGKDASDEGGCDIRTAIGLMRPFSASRTRVLMSPFCRSPHRTPQSVALRRALCFPTLAPRDA